MRLFITRKGSPIICRMFPLCFSPSLIQIHTYSASRIGGSFMFRMYEVCLECKPRLRFGAHLRPIEEKCDGRSQLTF